MSYKVYIDSCILVFYIKDVLPDASNEDLDIVINLCKDMIRKYESSGVLAQLNKVRENEYSSQKINQAIFLILNIFKEKYPMYKDNIERLYSLMKNKIIEEKKENLKR